MEGGETARVSGAGINGLMLACERQYLLTRYWNVILSLPRKLSSGRISETAMT